MNNWYLSDKEGYRGIYLKEPSKLVMEIPNCDIITPHKVIKWFPCCGLSNCKPLYILIFSLFFQEDIPVPDYFNFLPWDQDMLIYHRVPIPPHFNDALKLQKLEIAKAFKSLRQHTCSNHSELLLASKNRFLKSYVMMNTRCVVVDKTVCLMKNFDMLNHQFHSNVFLESTSTGVVVKSNEIIPSHSQVFLSYGPHDNLFLLLQYGFICLENPFDIIDISSFIISILSPSQCSLLQSNGYYGDYCITASGLNYRTKVALFLIEFHYFNILVDDIRFRTTKRIYNHFISMYTEYNQLLSLKGHSFILTQLCALYTCHLKLLNELLSN